MESVRQEALQWWRELDEDKKMEISNRYFPDKDFNLITTSSSTIEIIYLKENQNRKL
jgi:hypothetical protein